MSGAAGMAAIARQLDKIPDAAVADLVRWFIPRSQQVGGRMRWFDRNVKLSSKIRRRRHRGPATTVVLAGTPAACWSIKSYGRRGNYDVNVRRAEALATTVPGILFDRVHISRPTTGDGRWDRLVAEADRKLPDVTARLIDRRVF